MARTESIAIQVHPNDEQDQINLMQLFHWSLLSSQEVKTVDNHLERRGDSVYQIQNSERYCKLTFSRALDLPNLNEIKRLEKEFFSLRMPEYPALFPGGMVVWVVLTFIYMLGVILWCFYYFMSYKKKWAEIDEQVKAVRRRRQEILEELDQFG